MIYAVIDTTVIVSALLTKHVDSSTARVVQSMMTGEFTPLYNDEILDEYSQVLRRAKFHFSEPIVQKYLNVIKKIGIKSSRLHSDEHFPDPKDIVFYEVAMSKEDAYLVTGNTKHFPAKPIVVTPAELMEILDKSEA